MHIRDAQREVRTVFLGGFVGQAVSGLIWLVSAILGTWVSPGSGMVALVLGGVLIFPLTQLGLRLMGRRASLGADHPMNRLAMQVAFTLPLNLPLVGAATLYRQTWFYPAFLIVLGTHYLPFVFLYGMPQFYVLGGLLIAAGLGIGLYLPGTFSLGGWVGAALLLIFAFVGRGAVAREAGQPAGPGETPPA